MRRLLKWLAARLELREARPGWSELTAVLLDDVSIAAVNRAHLGRDRPTDVLAFAYPALPGECGRSGEILVNVEQAVREGRRRGGASRELALYLTHGVLHLAGYDDRSPADRRRMRRAERAWLREAAASGLVEGLLAPRTAPKRRDPRTQRRARATGRSR